MANGIWAERSKQGVKGQLKLGKEGEELFNYKDSMLSWR